MDSGQVIPSVAGSETPASCPGSRTICLAMTAMTQAFKMHHSHFIFFIYIYIFHIISFVNIIYSYRSYIVSAFLFCEKDIGHATNCLGHAVRLLQVPKKCGSFWQL